MSDVDEMREHAAKKLLDSLPDIKFLHNRKEALFLIKLALEDYRIVANDYLRHLQYLEECKTKYDD